MTTLGLSICFKTATVKWDHLEMPLPRTQKETEAEMNTAKLLKLQSQEPIKIQQMEQQANRILDSKYEPMIIEEKLKHLSAEHQEVMKEMLLKHKKLYDGHLGKAKGRETIPHPAERRSPTILQKAFSNRINTSADSEERDRPTISDWSLGTVHSPWGAPTFIIPKSNGRLRIVTDYHGIPWARKDSGRR